MRDAFNPAPIEELARMQPGLVVIGDSMAGTRIDPQAPDGAGAPEVAPLLHAGSGSA